MDCYYTQHYAMNIIIEVPTDSVQDVLKSFHAAEKDGRLTVKIYIENPTAEDQAIATKRQEVKEEGWIPTGDIN